MTLFATPAISSPVGQPRSAAEWEALFHVPASTDSWEINGHINGHYVRLRLPDEVAKLEQFPHDVRAIIYQRMHFRQTNLEILRKSFSSIADVLKSTSLQLTPEYEQSLQHLLLSIYPNGASQQSIYRHLPLLKALPDYTEIDLFVPEHLEGQVNRELASNNIVNKHRIHPVEVPAAIRENAVIQFPTTSWARDLLEVASDETSGVTYGLIPLAHARTENLTRPDNEYIQSLAQPSFQTLTVPLFFRSGNMTIGVANGKRYLFIGDRELQHLKSYYYNAFFFFPPDSAVVELLKALSGADGVVVLPNSENLFHLDMELVFLAPNVVAVLAPEAGEKTTMDDAYALRMARQNLRGMGFRIIDVPASGAQIRSFQSSTNAIPFRHAKTGRPTILVPQFEKTTLLRAGKEVMLQDLVERAYNDAGYDVIFVQDLFSDLHGNIHCAVHSL